MAAQLSAMADLLSAAADLLSAAAGGRAGPGCCQGMTADRLRP
ncbi:hypothetical protein ABT297_09905 [Dactylosporangium sp. NPDC000555]